MNCKEFEDKISLFIDGKLNNDDEKAFLDHSHNCQSCHRALENTRRMLGSLEDLNHIKAPKDLSKSIIQLLELELMDLGNEVSRENSKESFKGYVQKDEQENVQKNRQLEDNREYNKFWYSIQSSWIKKVSLAAVMVLIVTSAVIFSNDWLPSPIENDMVAMEGAEESAEDESLADDSEEVSDSIENGESANSEDGPGITAMDDEDTTFDEDVGQEEGTDRESMGEEAEAADREEESVEESESYEPDDAADGEGEAVEESGEDTFGIRYGIWIVLLLGIGVISVIVVLQKNRKIH